MCTYTEQQGFSLNRLEAKKVTYLKYAFVYNEVIKQRNKSTY